MVRARPVVRWAEHADKAEVARLLHGLMVFTGSLYGKPESAVRNLESVLSDVERTFENPRNIRFVVAEVDGAVAGVCCVEASYSTWHAKPYIVLNDLFVDERFRRRRIGADLLRFVVDHARATGCCRVDLFVESANRGARKLYEGFGFKQLEQESYSIPIHPSEGAP